MKIVTLEELRRMPNPQWLIEGVLETHAIGVIYGPSGEGKTFTGTDLAFCVATGESWCGRRTKQGTVIYIAAEGGAGIRNRAEAWLRHHVSDSDRTLPEVHYLLEPVEVRKEAKKLEDVIKIMGINPALIIVDTLGQCFLEGDENSANDMGQFARAARTLGTNLNAAVLIIHHTTKRPATSNRALERGSGALRGAADVMIAVGMKGDLITIKNTKQKDAAPFATINARLQVVPLDQGDGVDRDSCVLVEAKTAEDGGEGASPKRTSGVPDGDRLRALEVLIDAGRPLKSGAWWKTIAREILQPDLPERTFQNWRNWLVKADLVEPVENFRSCYQPTEKGRAMCASGTPQAA